MSRSTTRLARKDRQQPMLNFACWDLGALCEELRQELFPGLSVSPSVRFVQKGSLASITRLIDQAWTICLHAVLNSSDVPLNVHTYILKHELLHTEIEPREINGRLVDHLPDFFERERQISPELHDAKVWIWQNLGQRLRLRPRLECIQVRPYRLVYRNTTPQQRHVVDNSNRESDQ